MRGTLSVELATGITPGFEALAFKASRGIEDVYELTYICKDGSRFPAIVSITALRDDNGAIIGYLADRHRQFSAQTGRVGTERGDGRGRKSQSREIRFPLQHEP